MRLLFHPSKFLIIETALVVRIVSVPSRRRHCQKIVILTGVWEKARPSDGNPQATRMPGHHCWMEKCLRDLQHVAGVGPGEERARQNEPKLRRVKHTPATWRQIQNAYERHHADAPT